MTFPTINWSARATSATTDGGTSVTATEPTGAASGDLLLLFFASDGAQVTPTIDGFWTEIRLGDATGAWGGVWFGIRGASAPDYQISWSGGEDASATAVHVDAGTFNTTTPVDLTEDVFNTNTVSPIDAGPMAMTAGADRTTIAFGFGDGTGAVTQSDSGGFSTPVISNWTSRWFESFTAGGGRAAFWVDDAEYTGTDAALRWTRADDEWGTIIFAVEPAGVVVVPVTGDAEAVAVTTATPEQIHALTVATQAVVQTAGAAAQTHALTVDTQAVAVAAGAAEQIQALTGNGSSVAAAVGTLEQTHAVTGAAEAVAVASGTAVVTSEAAGILAHFATMV